MESGKMGFVAPTNIAATKDMERTLAAFGKAIKEMEETLIRDLEKDHPEHSGFEVSIKTDGIAIWSKVDQKSNTRISIKHTN